MLGVSISENDGGGARVLNLYIIVPFLPCNAIGLLLKFEIIGIIGGGLGPPKSIQIDSSALCS